MPRSPRAAAARRPLRATVLAALAAAALAAAGLQAQDFTDVVDSTGLSGPIDDFTTHTYARSAGARGSVVDMLVIRRFSQPIEDITVTIEGGQADDIGFVGGTLVTDVKPSCGGVGAVQAPIDVTDQVTVDGDEARLLLRAEENCCCVTGWGSATQSNRADARLHWEVTLGESEDFDLNLTTFIPADFVEGPPQSKCINRNHVGPGPPIQQLYFGGDGADRGFSPSAGSFRSRQLVTITPDENVDPDGIVDGSHDPQTGITRSFAEDIFLPGAPEDGIDEVTGDCHFLHEVGQGDAASAMSVETTGPPGNDAVAVRLLGDVSNPLVRLSPGIGWNLQVLIDASGDPVRYTVVGTHDGFPAYELYVNDTLVYSYHPGPLPYTFRDHLRRLFPPLDVSVNESGTLP